MPAPASRPRSRALLPSLPLTFSSPVRLPLRQQRTLSLRGPAVLLSKPTSFTPETDAKLLLLSPSTPPTAHGRHHAILSNLRLTFPDPATRDAFLRAAHAAILRMSAGISRYAVKATIRTGLSNHLYLVHRRHDATPFLMKVVGKHAMSCHSRLEGLVSERAVLAHAAARRVPFITRLVDAFETDRHLCLVLQRPQYGDLRTILQRAERGRLSERATRRLFAEVVLGVEECHRMGYLHRGVKLGAIQLDARGHVKLADFGLAKRMDVEYVGAAGGGSDSGDDDVGQGDRFQLVGRTSSFVGAKRYMSPEQIGGGGGGNVGYGAEADVWALGVVLYVMLVGKFPFGNGAGGGGGGGGDEDTLYEAICGQPLRVPKGVRKEAKELLEGLLQRDVRKRWDLHRVKSCAWMRGIDWRDLRFSAEHGEPAGEVLRDLRDNGVEVERYDEEEESELSFSRISVGSAGSSVSSSGSSRRSSDGKGKMAELVGFGHINYPQRAF